MIQGQLGCADFGYVSLGSGDGEKDAELIYHWLNSDACVFYYPYDISLPLVSTAHQTVREKVEQVDADRVSIKAVLADFNYLGAISTVFNHRPAPNVISLLGNSLGNMAHERTFLRKLAGVMSQEDVLVLEVRLQLANNELHEVETEQAMRFDFGPLEYYLGMPFDPGRMKSERVSRASTIKSTKTTVVTCSHDTYRDIKLSYIHEYERQSFTKALEDSGFEDVQYKVGGEGGKFLVCIARPKKFVRNATGMSELASRGAPLRG
jgi:Histidine-specific methyltransferase, SAM-dependent